MILANLVAEKKRPTAPIITTVFPPTFNSGREGEIDE